MKILIHAVPQRMWYVQNFMIPQLREQGYEGEQIFLDDRKLGNLEACLQAFEQLPDEGGTWHLQDDLLLAKDFVKRAGAWKGHVANGFCCIPFHDSPWTPGTVYMPDLWHSFQCIYIPNRIAKEFAAWIRAGLWIESPNQDLPAIIRANKGDDTLFREFLFCRYPGETCYNFKPNLVEHIDWLIGGSTLSTSGKWFPDLPDPPSGRTRTWSLTFMSASKPGNGSTARHRPQSSPAGTPSRSTPTYRRRRIRNNFKQIPPAMGALIQQMTGGS